MRPERIMINSDVKRHHRISTPLIISLTCFVTATVGAPTAHSFQYRWLTHPQATIDYWPRFSPDGNTVLFTRQAAQTSVFDTVPARGGAISPFLDMTGDGYNVTRADWDWNTNQIALTAIATAVSPQVLSTWIVNGDGTDPVQVPITSPISQPAYPSWREDKGSATVVESALNSNDSAVYNSLNEVDITTGALVAQYTDTSVIWTGEPSVSHAQDQIAFAGQMPYPPGAYDDNNNQIWLLATDSSGTALHQLDGLQGRTPDWSPDDAFLLFESTRACANGNYAIFIEASSGGKAIQMTSCRLDANHAVWAPDGKHFAFAGQYFNENGCSNGCRGIAISPVSKKFRPLQAHFENHYN
jgi:Tol biopolymer transport system component